MGSNALKREGKELFSFEGEAYVYGIMNGEAFEDKPETRTFVLV